MTRTAPRRLGLRFAAVAAALVVAAGVCELVLRITHWGVYEPVVADYHLLANKNQDGTDEGFWFFDLTQPTVETWDHDPYGVLPPGATITYRLNSHGLRGPEPDPVRPKVLFVGDSFTFGEGVLDDEIFAARVERSLAKRFEPAPQMLPAAVPGYGSEHEAARLPKWLYEFRPKLVVLVYVVNDPIPLDVEETSPSLLVDRRDPPFLMIARLAQSVLLRSTNERRVEEWYRSFYFGENADRWEKTRADLAQMKKDATEAGAKFAVILFPLIHKLKERPFAQIHDAVAGRCRELGAPFLDLTDALAVEPERSLWVHPVDHHPNKRAHELAAAAIAPFVESLLR